MAAFSTIALATAAVASAGYGAYAGERTNSLQRQGRRKQEAAQKEAITPPDANGVGAKMMQAEADIDINERKFQQEASLAERKADLDERIKLRESEQDARLKEEQAATERMVRVQQASQPQPTTQGSPK
mgnify:CR=1 FL=1